MSAARAWNALPSGVKACPHSTHVAENGYFVAEAIVGENGRARCYEKLSVCLSVRLSVTFRYGDHRGWSSMKIISRPKSVRPALADPNMGDLVQREHSQN